MEVERKLIKKKQLAWSCENDGRGETTKEDVQMEFRWQAEES